MTGLGFGEIITGTYHARPNRFVVQCRLDNGRLVRAFMPNPGRLWELLLPGVRINLSAGGGPMRKTRFTVMAVERDSAPVFLHTHANNRVARHLLESNMVPGLEGARIVRAEAPVGRSRFDFLLERAGRPLLLEVKSCTLFGNGVAMFPDAVTERGRRHLLELQALGREGAKQRGQNEGQSTRSKTHLGQSPLCTSAWTVPISQMHGLETAVVFVVHTPAVKWFMPDFHTDLAFSRTLCDVREDVRILPVSVTWTNGLEMCGQPRLVEIPWAHIERETEADRGAYMLLVRINRAISLDAGGLGRQRFAKGWHIYAGSAMANLTARLNRHLRKRMHWHIDWLCQAADSVTPLPIRSSERLEHGIVRELAGVFAPGPEGFGASDSPHATHLFYSERDPLSLPVFHRLLQDFRMRPPR